MNYEKLRIKKTEMKNVIHILRRLWLYFYVQLKQKNFGGTKLKYLYLESKKNDSLMIIFSSMDKNNNRRYHYLKSFSNLDIDKLYILDPYGYRGSYWLYENGQSFPQEETMSLLQGIINQKKYKEIYTAGTSKGGTAAIYYGLAINASEIYSGACQYNIGSYLYVPVHMDIFFGMMGGNAADKECLLLNLCMPKQIERYKESKSIIHILYSKKEHTYESHIVDLFGKLDQENLNYKKVEFYFEKHSDVGYPFIEYVSKEILKKKFKI